MAEGINMKNLVNHARRMVEESDMTLDAKMEVLDFLQLDKILELKEYKKLGTVEELKVAIGWNLCSKKLPEKVDHLADGQPKSQYLVVTKDGRFEVAEWLEIYGKPLWMSHYSEEIKDVVKWQLLS